MVGDSQRRTRCREPVVDDRFRIDPTSSPSPVAVVPSARELEWPQIGVGLALGVLARARTGACRAHRGRPPAGSALTQRRSRRVSAASLDKPVVARRVDGPRGRSQYGFGVSRVAVRCAALRFDRGTLRVRRSAALRSWRLSAGMPGMCPFSRLPNLRAAEPGPTVMTIVSGWVPRWCARRER